MSRTTLSALKVFRVAARRLQLKFARADLRPPADRSGEPRRGVNGWSN
jgi:hypothetical protein